MLMFETLFSISNPLFTLSILLVFGIVLGKVARKLRLPSIIGHIAAGVLIGPYGLSLFKPEVFENFTPITDFALCLFGLSLGTHLILRKLRSAGKRILFILIAEILLVPTIIFSLLFFLGNVPITQAILLSAIGLTTSPSTIIQLVHENRSKGIFTKTLVTSVALNNIASLILFWIMLNIALSLVGRQGSLAVPAVFFAPVKEIAGAGILGTVMAFGLIYFTRKQASLTYYFSFLIIVMLLIAGFSQSLQLPGFLASMVLGFFISNYSSKKHILMKSITNIEPGIYTLFFVLAGTHLDFKMIQTAGMVGIAFIAARALGKYIAPTVGAYLSGSPTTIKRWIGISLFPQAGISIGFVLIIKSFTEFSPFADIIIAIILGSVVVFEILGSLLTDIAIEMSGEKNKGHVRLLDFLQEEYILVGLKKTDKWEALEEMSRFMHRVHGVREISQEELTKSIIEREKTMSTGIGEGVAVPHAIIEGGPKIRGVIGISHKGIDFNSLDGQPVYLIVLVATPQENYDQHLRVLASIAKIFGHDPETKNRIFNARTAGEVHEILQTGNPDALNVYLEE